jgi:DNA-binding MarR family transcriptional regulator
MAKRELFVSLSNPDRYIEQIDVASATGRISKQRSPFGKRWHKMAFDTYRVLAKSSLTGADFRVLFMIMPWIHNGNMVKVNQSVLARELNTQQSSVSRSIRRLISVGVLDRLDTMAGRAYFLNPHFGWYGADNGEHTQAVNRWDDRNACIQ